MTTKTGTKRATPARSKTKPKTDKPAEAKVTPATRRKTPVAAKVAPKLVEVKEAVVNQPELRKKELIDLVVERSGAKKKDAKPAIEAALAILGEAMAEGRELNLRPLGKIKISRREEKANGTVIVCRIRQPKEDAPAGPETYTSDTPAHAAE
ncbi:MAG: HU family DNA-binding protein [Aestuariivita sp.]|uniref:HU family DNA-binding protein n=1 Tax=Aestuariivita sp. TaxID=1872407 RepID=UPI003BB16AD7